jgi:Holliday junction resolvasome RuvABC endonuclease subunit
MRVLGVDPSSSICGVALVEDGILLEIDAWHRPKNGSAPERLLAYQEWFTAWTMVRHPHIACIEFLSVERNAQTTRVISHYQAVSAVVCKKQGMLIVEARVTSARKAALGDGSLSKEKAFALIKQRFPEYDFGRIDKGGGDKSDAVVLALAATSLAESS